MRKKILIGSMLVLAMLLLMPSIPAVQQKSVEEGFKQDIQEKLESINLMEELKDIGELEWIRHPILYALVVFLLSSRWERAGKLYDFSIIRNYYSITIIHPIIFLIGLYIEFFRVGFRMYLWNNISDKLGWGWNITYNTLRDN